MRNKYIRGTIEGKKEMRNLGKKILLPILALSMLLSLSACGSKTGDTGDQESKSPVESSQANNDREEPLVITLSGGDCGYPSPYLHYSRGPGSFKMRLVFDSLLEHGEEGLIPWLAEDYNISEDGLTYTFKIREGVKWHDGEEMSPEDVLFSFEYQTANPPVGGISTALGKENNIITDMTIDGNNFIVTLSQKSAAMLNNLGSVRIIPKHIWENVENPKEFTDEVCGIGCGPYMITEYNKEQGTYKFEAFKDYWGQNQEVDVIQFVPVSDGILAFDSGEIDLTGITPDVYEKYAHSDEYKIINNPGFWGYKMGFNLEKAPALQDINVRKAIAYAINRTDLIDKVARGAAILPGEGYIPQQSVWYNKNVKAYEFDPEKAKDLLDGKTYDFKLTISSSNDEVRMAELIKLNLADVGINITVESVDSKTRDSMYKNGEYQLILNGYGGWGGDPELLLSQYAYGAIPGYSNEQINKLCDEQLLETDQAKRMKIVYELQNVIADEVPQLPLYNTTGMSVYRPAKYDGWTYMFDHHETTHPKISYLAEK